MNTEEKANELYRDCGMERLHYGADEAEWNEVVGTIHSAYRDKAAEFGSSSKQGIYNMLER